MSPSSPCTVMCDTLVAISTNASASLGDDLSVQRSGDSIRRLDQVVQVGEQLGVEVD